DADVIIPRELPRSVDSLANRLGFLNTVLSANATQLVNWGKNVQWAGRQLTVGFTVPLSIFAGMAGKMAFDVESQLVRVQKVYDTTATSMAGREAELAQLRSDSYTMAANSANLYGASIDKVFQTE